MYLVQLLLPVYDNDGARIEEAEFAEVRRTLADRFGGVTAYMRAPAKGLWKAAGGAVDRDDVVMVEVVVKALDRAWWNEYRERLERAFRQQAILARAIAIEPL